MVGRTVAQYHFIEKLGAGGMGEIYKAQDTRLNRFVAIKVLTSETAGDPERRRRFLQEAQAASALNHPNIITIHDIANEGDAQFMVMENVQGKTLADLIPKGGLRVPQVLKFAVQMADALAAAHNAGIIHRDLKPGNVMVTESGLVKVLDFGLAKLTDRSPLGSNIQDDATRTMADAPLTVEGAIIGTVSYMSPEQAQGRKIDPRSDIFSMGLLVYEMATGTRAFQGDSALSTLSSILRDDPRPVHDIAPDVPPELEQVISRCLRKIPDDRWQTMVDLQRALAALKHESDSGVLYRSRLSSPANPGFASTPSQVVTGQRPGSQPSGWVPPPPSQLPVSQVSPPGAHPSQHVSHPSQAPFPQQSSASQYPQQQQQPLLQQPPSGLSQSGIAHPQTGTIPPGTQPHPSQQMPPPGAKKPQTGMILGIVGGVLALGAIGGGVWWATHRTPTVVEENKETPEVAKVETPPLTETKSEESKAAETKAADAKAAETKAAETKAAADANKGKDAKSATPPVQPPNTQAKSTPPPTQNQKGTLPPVLTPTTTAKETTPPPVVETPKPPTTPPPVVVTRNTVAVAVPDARPFMIRLMADVPADADEGTPLRFTVRDDFKIGDILVVAKGAAVTGQIVDGGKKRIIGGTKMTLRLIDAELYGGGKLRLRALPGKRADGNYERPVDTGVKKSKDVAAGAGTEYVAYVDSDQNVNVRK